MTTGLRFMVGPDEKKLYQGKPDLKCFVFETIFNPSLPIVILWGALDLFVLGNLIFAKGSGKSFFVGFILIHMTPVWIYLSSIIFMARKYRNIEYIVTDKAIYVSGGVFSRTYRSKPFADLSHIDLHRSVFDQLFNVGDVIATTSHIRPNQKSATITLNSILNFTEVYNLIKKLQQDIYTDIMFPNEYRPDVNRGYKTEYKGFE